MYSPLEQFEVLRFLDSINVMNNNEEVSGFLQAICFILFENEAEKTEIFSFFNSNINEEIDQLNETVINILFFFSNEADNSELFDSIFNSLMYIYTEILLELYNDEPLKNYYDIFDFAQNVKLSLIQFILMFLDISSDEMIFLGVLEFSNKFDLSYCYFSSIVLPIFVLLAQLYFINPYGEFFDMHVDFFINLQVILTIWEENPLEINFDDLKYILNDLFFTILVLYLFDYDFNGTESVNITNIIEIFNDFTLLPVFEQFICVTYFLEEVYLMECSFIIEFLYDNYYPFDAEISHSMLINDSVNILKLLLNYFFNNLTITLILIFGFFIFFINIFFLQTFIISSKIQLIFSALINFIKNLFNDLITTNIAKFYYFQLLFLLFLLLLVINLFGLLPYTFVLTAQFCFTFSCAFIYFFSLNFTGIYLHGIKLLNLFFPTGAPIFIAPLLVMIEIISYFARVFSLSIRLFANITAGHILLKIIAWFIWSLYNYIFASIPGVIIICILWFLEFFISILQAYVFTILLCIYLTDVINLH